jgi:hypothetical protein
MAPVVIVEGVGNHVKTWMDWEQVQGPSRKEKYEA